MDEVKEGVRIFRVGQTTALVTDWSKEGLGFVLLGLRVFTDHKSPIGLVKQTN